MDKKRLEYYKKKLLARREELTKTIARTQEEGRTADEDPTVELADKAVTKLTVRAVIAPRPVPDRGKITRGRRDGRKPAHVGRLPGALYPRSGRRGYARFRRARRQ